MATNQFSDSVKLLDNIKLLLGTDSDFTIRYNTADSLLKIDSDSVQPVLTISKAGVISGTITAASPFTVGTDDSVAGAVYVYGSATQEAIQRWYLAADTDSVTEYFELNFSSDDLILGPTTNADMVKLNAEGTLVTIDGGLTCTTFTGTTSIVTPTINIGTNDSVLGTLYLHGNATSGPPVQRFYESGDNDAVTEYFEATFTSDDFILGPTTNVDMLRLNAEGTIVTVDGQIVATTGDINGQLEVNSLLLNLTQDYIFTENSTELSVQAQTAGSASALRLFAKDGDNTDNVIIGLYSLGTPGATTNSESVQLQWNAAASAFRVTVTATGSGTVRPLYIGNSAFLTAIVVEAAGRVSFNGSTSAVVRMPNLTTAERDALTPAAGDVVYNTSTSVLNFYNGAAWGAV